MKLWLDDMRAPPGEDYYWAKTAADARRACELYCFNEMSLDHDLGHPTETGYWFLCWLEAEIRAGRTPCPKRMSVHSQNPAGASRMIQVVRSIQDYVRQTSIIHTLPAENLHG